MSELNPESLYLANHHNHDQNQNQTTVVVVDFLTECGGTLESNLDTASNNLTTANRTCYSNNSSSSSNSSDTIDINTNNTSSLGSSYFFYETEQFVVMWFLLLSIVVGNLAVLAALRLSKARKSRTNFFIMHLALADLSVGLISVLTDLVWKSTVAWHAGNLGCKVVRFAQVLVTYSSTYVLVALSIDRCDAITHPMNFSGSRRRARRLVAAAWLLSAVFAAPSLVLFMEASIDGVPQCWIELSEAWQWQVYMCLVAMTVVICPTVIITACYTVIVYTIWSKGRVMTVRTKAVVRNGEKRGMMMQEEDSRRASSRGLIPKAKVKTVKMTLVIVLMFVLCWSPYFVFDLLQVFDYVPQTPTNIAVATFIQSLAPLNSAANPLIYCLFSTHICRNLRRIRAVEWVVGAACPCLECSHQPQDGTSFQRRTTEFSSLSTDASTRRSTLSLRYYPMRQMVTLAKSSTPSPPRPHQQSLAGGRRGRGRLLEVEETTSGRTEGRKEERGRLIAAEETVSLPSSSLRPSEEAEESTDGGREGEGSLGGAEEGDDNSRRRREEGCDGSEEEKRKGNNCEDNQREKKEEKYRDNQNMEEIIQEGRCNQTQTATNLTHHI